MTSLPEQLSAVRQSQWEAQLDVFRTLTSRALENAEQLIALNLKATRATVEQATGTVQQLLQAKDPRDLIAIGSQAQGQWQQLFSYSRELLGIAGGFQLRTLGSFPAPALAAPAQLLQVPAPAAQPAQQEQAAIAVADATTVHSDIAAAAADTGAALAEATLDAAQHAVAQAAQAAPTELQAEKTGEATAEIPEQPKDDIAVRAEAANDITAQAAAAIETAIADNVPTAKAKPLAKALSEVSPKPAGAEHPVAATLPQESAGHVELPVLTPSETTQVLQLSQGPAQQAKTSRASRRK